MKKQKTTLQPVQGRKITKEMSIFDVIEKYPETLEVFSKYNLPCIGCAAAHFENIEAIAKEFDIDIKKFLKDLNKAVK